MNAGRERRREAAAVHDPGAASGMPRSNASVVVRDDAGAPWGVFDSHDPLADGSRLRLGARGAPFRLFVAPDGRRRVYAFRPGEDRACEPTALARQMREARAATVAT